MKSEDFRNLIRQVVNEELKIHTKQHWLNPAMAELDSHIYPSHVHEAGPGIGKNERGKFVSAGTIDNVHGRKMSKAQINARDGIGKKLLNALRRGKGAGIGNTINSMLSVKGYSTKPKDLYHFSQVWALASDLALKGNTASSVQVNKTGRIQGKKPKSTSSKTKKKSGGTQKKSQPQAQPQAQSNTQTPPNTP